MTDLDITVLRSFAENNMCIAATAKKLYMHWNTVKYHLDRIRHETGKNPSEFFDLVYLIQLANLLPSGTNISSGMLIFTDGHGELTCVPVIEDSGLSKKVIKNI